MKTVRITIPQEDFIYQFIGTIAPYTFGVGLNCNEIAEQILAVLNGWA